MEWKSLPLTYTDRRWSEFEWKEMSLSPDASFKRRAKVTELKYIESNQRM
jgi:hypothetical protein